MGRAKETKLCQNCGKQRPLSQFFKSTSKYHGDGRIPICRHCIVDAVYDVENDCLDVDEFRQLLRQIDKPFLSEVLDTAWKQYEDGINGKTSLNILPKEGRELCNTIVGFYFQKLNSMKQYKGTTYADGELATNETVKRQSQRTGQNDVVYYLEDDNFTVTEDMIRLFGDGYTLKEYQTMQRIYDDTKQDYPSISSNQKNLLLRYVRFAAKEEIATSSGIIADAEKWAKMASDALKQLNSIENQGKISSFSEFFQKFEREKDVTRILPQFKYRPNDAPDFIIWCYINYCRRLEGKPEVPYEDVYKFYDEKVTEYVKQYGDPYGIFTDDPTLKNREKIKEFITLPPDYYGDSHE